MGEVTDIVNSGVALIHLLANHAGVQTVAGGYANGFPVGYDGNGAIGASFKQIAKQWKQTSEWYDFLTADFDFTVGVSWLWGIHTNGHGHYVDQITATLEVRYLPIDFTVDVQANFPTHGNKFGTEDDVIAAMRSCPNSLVSIGSAAKAAADSSNEDGSRLMPRRARSSSSSSAGSTSTGAGSRTVWSIPASPAKISPATSRYGFAVWSKLFTSRFAARSRLPAGPVTR